MSAVLDIAIAVIIGLSVFFGAKNGFVKTAISAGSIIIAVVVVIVFAPKLQGVFLQSSAADSVRNEIGERIAKILPAAEGEYDPEEVKEQSEFKSLLSIVGIDTDEFEAKFQTWKTNQTDELREDLVRYVSEPLVKAIATLLSFIILFFGSLLALKVVSILLDKVCVLPVLKQANSFLGILLGIVLALVKVSVFVFLVNLLLPYFQAKDTPLLSKMDPAATVLFKWFEKIDIISWLI